MYQAAETGLRPERTHRSGVRAEQNCWNLSRSGRCIHGEMGRRSGTMGRRDQGPPASNRWADSKEPIPKCQNTDRHGEWRCEVEQYPKLSSDEIGRPRVDLQSPLTSPPPILPPGIARSMTHLRWTTPRPIRLCRAMNRDSALWPTLALIRTVWAMVDVTLECFRRVSYALP